MTEGTLNIVVDGRGDPAALIREIKVDPFLEVTEDFAATEGEGDLSLERWRREHRAFFARVAPYYGREFSDAELVQCETFEVVHPK
ncbi:ASCH domain-containing protein [Corynebacterium jeddahense]|uniref:ASCH domain-containing protein n=1 Tax=Corynebacterium jeddahense TaxID=1414719 RepID=UPI003B5C8759